MTEIKVCPTCGEEFEGEGDFCKCCSYEAYEDEIHYGGSLARLTAARELARLFANGG